MQAYMYLYGCYSCRPPSMTLGALKVSPPSACEALLPVPAATCGHGSTSGSEGADPGSAMLAF